MIISLSERINSTYPIGFVGYVCSISYVAYFVNRKNKSLFFNLDRLYKKPLLAVCLLGSSFCLTFSPVCVIIEIRGYIFILHAIVKSNSFLQFAALCGVLRFTPYSAAFILPSRKAACGFATASQIATHILLCVAIEGSISDAAFGDVSRHKFKGVILMAESKKPDKPPIMRIVVLVIVAIMVIGAIVLPFL